MTTSPDLAPPLRLVPPLAVERRFDPSAVRTSLDHARLIRAHADARGIDLRHVTTTAADPGGLLIRYPDAAWRWATDVDRTRLATALAAELRATAETSRRRLAAELSDRDRAYGTSTARSPLLVAADRLESVAPVRDAFHKLAALPGIPLDADEVDADPDLLGTASGVVDLRSGTLRPFGGTDLVTRGLPIAYDHEATAPRWVKFVEDTFGDGADFLRRVYGYGITGHTSERILLVLAGEESPAKYALRTVLADVFGALHHEASPGILDVGGPTPLHEFAAMRGSRLVHVHGPRTGATLDAPLLTRLTGSARIPAKEHYKRRFDYVPAHLVTLSTSSAPDVSGLDRDFLDRVRVVTIPADADAAGVVEALAEERAGILAWLVAGAVDWRRGGLAAPASVEADSAAYRDEAHPLSAYLAEVVIFTGDADDVVHRSALWPGYRAWCDSTGETFVPSRKFTAGVEDLCGFPKFLDHNAAAFRGMRRR